MKKILLKIRKRLSNSKLMSDSGETITEALLAMLVMALAMLMLAGAIVTAAKVNRSTKSLDTAFHTEGGVNDSGTVSVKEQSGQVIINHAATGSDEQVDVIYHVTGDGNEYWYYQ